MIGCFFQKRLAFVEDSHIIMHDDDDVEIFLCFSTSPVNNPLPTYDTYTFDSTKRENRLSLSREIMAKQHSGT